MVISFIKMKKLDGCMDLKNPSTKNKKETLNSLFLFQCYTLILYAKLIEKSMVWTLCYDQKALSKKEILKCNYR